MALTGSQIDGNDLTDESVTLDKLTLIGATPGHVIVVNNVGTIEYKAIEVEDIDGITSVGAAVGESLVWNGTGWAPGAPVASGSGGATTLDELLDAQIVTPADKQVLQYDSNTNLWVNSSIDYSDLSGTPTLVTTIDQLADVTIIAPTNNQVMVYNGAGFLNIALTKSLISDFNDGDYATAAQGTLADSALQPGGSNSSFTNDEGYLTSTTAPSALGLSTVATTGEYTDLLNVPTTFTATAHTHTKVDITDFSDGDYATAAQGTLADSALQLGANTSDLTNDSGFLVDSAVFNEVAGESLVYNGTNWINQSLLKASILDLNEGDYATAAQGTLADSALQPGAAMSGLTNDAGYLQGSITLGFLTDVSTAGATTGQILKFNGTTWVPGEDTSNGEANTASNLGTGENVFSAKSSSDLQFKSIVAGTNVSITSDANEITINSATTGEINTASNLGAGHGTFSAKSSSDLQFKSIVAGANVTLNSTANDITIEVPMFDYTSLINIPTTFTATAHTHTKVDITDFSDGDYATAAQGTLADSALQTNSLISSLVNDEGYLTGGASVNDLSDINTGGATAGQVLKFDGSNWIPGNDDSTGGVVAHTHTKADITDFNEGDYATAAQGALADAAAPVGAGLSVFVNDTGFLDGGSSANDLLDIVTTGATSGDVLKFNGAEWVPNTDTSGEQNAGINSADTGEGMYVGKTGLDLEFKRIKQGAGIIVSSDATSITIDNAYAPGETNTATSVGFGDPIVSGKVGSDLQFKSLIAGTDIVLSSTGGDITINSTSNIISLDDLTDVTLTAPAQFETLISNGVEFINTPITESLISDFGDYATVAELNLAVLGQLVELDPISLLDNDVGYLTGASVLNDIYDVVALGASAPTDGQVLKWFENEPNPSGLTTGVWKPANETAGTGTGGGDPDQNLFNTFSVTAGTGGAASGANITAATPTSTLTLEAGSNVTLTSSNNTITIDTASGIDEAPEDGTPYSRQDASWVSAGTGGLAEAPNDGKQYGRQNATWTEIVNVGGGSTSLTGLTDTNPTATGDRFLKWDNTGTTVNYVQIAKADIVNFSENDYATGAEGDLAVSALQNITNENLGDLLDVNQAGVADGEVLTYNAGVWTPVANSTATNLGYTPANNKGTVTSDTGANAIIPLADGANAGLMTPVQKSAIEANTLKVSNVVTDLGYTPSALNGIVTSSDGNDAILPLVVAGGDAGLMTGADKSIIDNLGTTYNPLLPTPAGAGLVLKSTGALAGDYEWGTDISGSGGDGNDFVDGISFNTGDGIITVSRNGLADLTTVSLDGRYALSGHAHPSELPTLVEGKVLKVVSGILSWEDDIAGTGGLTAIVQDTAPQLGGDLDVFSNAVSHAITTSEVGGDINLTPGTGGKVNINGAGTAIVTSGTAEDLSVAPGAGGKLLLNSLEYPNTDGGAPNAGFVLTTNGAGVLSFAEAVTNTPVASNATTGTVKLISDTPAGPAEAVTTTASRTYGVQLDASGQAVVNVPWTSGTGAGTELDYAPSGTFGTLTSSTATGPAATVPAATTLLAGLMTNADKTKLDGIATGANVNQSAFTTIKITGTAGQPDVVAEEDSDTLTLIAGTGITLTSAPVGDAITITSSGGGAASPLSIKGEIYAHNGTADAAVPASITNGQVLTIDTAEPTGMKWAAAGAASFGHEWAILQFQSGNSLNPAATTTSGSNITVTHDGTAANVTGFDFTGYTRPPVSINIYSQNITNGLWSMVDTSALVENPIEISDANGGTETPDLINFGTPFTGTITMGLPITDTGAVNGGLPVKYARLLVNFTFSG